MIDDAGKRLAFVAGKGKSKMVMHDDTPIGVHPVGEFAVGIPPILSADGSVVAYKLIIEQSGKSYVLSNGKAGPQFDFIGQIVLSSDGKQLAYLVETGEGDRLYIIVGDDRRGPYAWVRNIVFTGRGKTLAYAADTFEGWSAFIGGRVLPCPEDVKEVFVSPDGSNVGYIISQDQGGDRVQLGEHLGPVFTEVHTPVFDDTGKRIAYRALLDRKTYVVVGSIKIEAPGVVSDPVWSGDGNSLSYGAHLGQKLLWKTVSIE